MDDYLTVKEVAAMLQVSPETVRRLVRAGRLPVTSLAPGPVPGRGGYRIRRSDVVALLESGVRGGTPREAAGGDPDAAPSDPLGT